MIDSREERNLVALMAAIMSVGCPTSTPVPDPDSMARYACELLDAAKRLEYEQNR